MLKRGTKNITESNNNAEGHIELSIIIISYNTKEVTVACIKSIYDSQWHDAYEIIVVDNNSTDGSVEMIREKYPDVRLIVNPDNKFFAIANNQGVKIAKGKYVLLLNSDTIVENDNLQRMIDFIRTQPDDVICVGPKILNKDRSLQSCGNLKWGSRWHQYVSQYHFDRILPLHIISPILDRRPNVTHTTGWVSGCCMMMPRDKYLEVGGLNENLVFYGEEPEFGYRTDKLGFRTVYYADAEIIHLGGVSTNKAYDFDKEIKQYNGLVQQTIGSKRAAQVTQRTITSLRIKKLFYRNKDFISQSIRHEKRVLAYFKNNLKKESRN